MRKKSKWLDNLLTKCSLPVKNTKRYGTLRKRSASLALEATTTTIFTPCPLYWISPMINNSDNHFVTQQLCPSDHS